MRRSPFLAVALALALALALAAPAAAQARNDAPPAPGQATLLARAVLPARTFAPGPVSGTLLGPAPINGVPVPFDGQPVQGFSATMPAGHGRYRVMPDNGYGAIENSADFDLRVYLVEPRLETARGGPGTIAVKDFFELRDPGHRIPFAIVNDFTRARVLTGADFDIESLQRAPDGTLWTVANERDELLRELGRAVAERFPGSVDPAAVETMRAGIWVTRPSPTVNTVYVFNASVSATPCCRTPINKPATMLIAVIRIVASASR